jgi:hypothetical protein
MRRCANIYIGEDRIILEPLGFLNGVWYGGVPTHRLPHSATAAEILAELEPTLAEGQQPKLPIDLKVLQKPLLAATGEKTWRAVSRAFACVDVEETDAELVFSPWVPDLGGFSGSGKDWRCDKSNPQEKETAFRTAAAIAIEAQNLHNPPPLS